MFNLDFTHSIIINDLPLQWMTRIELFSPDLEQFPLMYIHKLANQQDVKIIGNYNLNNKQRIFGFVLATTWSMPNTHNGLCDVEINFICNIPQNHHSIYDNLIKEEIEHRIGIADKVSREDLPIITNNSPKSLALLQKIWDDKISAVYGDYIPHGRIFDEVYGIIRFSASGNAPKLGKISEHRMLYWYVKDIGGKVELTNSVRHLSFIEFYLLPTYEELKTENFKFFNIFQSFFHSTKNFWEYEYTDEFSVNGSVFKAAPKDHLPISGNDFESRYQGILNSNDYDNISLLRQIFNRMPGRLYGYIWNIMTPLSVDFYTAFQDRNTFKEFYRDHAKQKGSSAKVIACYLQQSFGLEAFPIDTWVKTFIYYPLGLNSKSDGKAEPSSSIQNTLYDDYHRLDKLEKLIWAASMGNKTNKTEFLDILWCQRYGTDKGANGSCRGANPLSCANCVLTEECISYQSIKNDDIFISDDIQNLKRDTIKNELFYGVLTEHKTPRKVYTKKGRNIEERDSHSGLSISSNIQVDNGRYTIEEFINLLQ